LNKKILSFIFGSLLIFSLFGAIEFQEVSAQTWSVALTSATSGTAYFNKDNMPMNFTVKVTYNSILTGARLDEVWVTAPAGYTFDNAGSQPSPPSGWAIDYVNSDSSNVVYTHSTGVYGSSTITFTVKVISCTAAENAPLAWTISDGGSPVNLSDLSLITIVDTTPPKFDLKYIKSPKVENIGVGENDILGLGTVTIQLTSDEPVAPTSGTGDRPVVKVKQINKTETTVTMASQIGTYPASIFTGSYSITSTSGASDGLATVTVSAKDLAGNIGTVINTSGPTYDGASFIVDSQCPVPVLATPLTGAAIVGPSVTFVWNEIPDSANKNVTYTLQYSTSSTFASNVITVAGPFDDVANTFLGTPGTGWTVPSPTTRAYTANLTPATYYWRVKAADTLNNESAYSGSRSLTVTSEDPDPPTFRIRYVKTPKIDYDTTPDVIGGGSMQIRIYASETLKTRPTVQVKLHNQATWTALTITESAPGSTFTATYNVPTASTNNGLAQVTISGTDMSDNIGTTILDSEWDASRAVSPYLPTELDSDGAFFYVDTATDSPSLYKPDNGYVIPANNNIAEFTFYKISDISAERPADDGQNNCITYHIQYSTSSSFATNVVTQSVDIDETATPTPVFCDTGTSADYNNWNITTIFRKHKSEALSNGTWYWRVWATDRLGNQSPYSETRSFKVSTSIPNLMSPSDLSLLIDNDPTLEWEKVPTATFYNIRLSRGSNSAFLDYTLYPDRIAVNNFLWADADPSPAAYDVSTSTPPTPAIGRLEDGVWYWKVASSLDTTVYSEVWRFTVDTTGPPAPNLLTLTDGQVSQNKRPTFTWGTVSDTNDLSNPVRYYIQISGDPTFPDSDLVTPGWQPVTIWPGSSLFTSWETVTYQRGPLTTTSFVPANDFPETLLTSPSNVYYWRVYAVDSAGNLGTNSLTRNFRVSTSPALLWGDSPAGSDTTCEEWPDDCMPGDGTRDNLALALRSPSNGFTLNSYNPQLEWRHSRCDCVVKEISSYVIQYSKDITFPAAKTTEVSGVFQVLGINTDNNLYVNMGYTIQTPLYNGTYFWRICAVDTAGNRTQFTAPWSFTVNVPDNEGPGPTPQCSTTVPCPTGFTCQNGACVPVTYTAGNLTITVQNSTGTAISGASVTVDGTAQTTNASGQVTFNALTGGSHTINNVTAAGYTDSGTSNVIVNGATAHTVTMVSTGTEGYVWGTVYFNQIGTAAPNIVIDVYNQSTDVKVFSGLTNSEGKFQSTALPGSGTYYLKIDSYDKELRDLQPTSLATGEKIIILETKGTINGIVQDDSGQIVTGATVVLKRYPGEEFVDTQTSDRIGQFTFEALPGSYIITISKAGYDAYTSSSFSVQSQQTVNLQSVLGNIVLNALKGTLTVSVKNEAGSVINTATVNIRSSTGTLVRSVSTVNGTATTQLAPGAYRVSAVSSGYAESLQQTSNITSNQTSSLSITLAPATGSIRVVAKDADGAPLAGAEVYLDGQLSGITDENGELLLTGLKLGEHTVRVTKGGYTAIEQQVTAGETASVVDTTLPKSRLWIYIAIGLVLLALAALIYYFFFRGKGGSTKQQTSRVPALAGRTVAPKLRPHRHKGGLPPSSIRVKKKNL